MRTGVKITSKFCSSCVSRIFKFNSQYTTARTQINAHRTQIELTSQVKIQQLITYTIWVFLCCHLQISVGMKSVWFKNQRLKLNMCRLQIICGNDIQTHCCIAYTFNSFFVCRFNNIVMLYCVIWLSICIFNLNLPQTSSWLNECIWNGTPYTFHRSTFHLNFIEYQSYFSYACPDLFRCNFLYVFALWKLETSKKNISVLMKIMVT